MASQSGYNDAGGSGQGRSSELRARDLPSKRLLGKGLASIGYETELNGERFARKDFIGVPSGIFQKEAAVLVGLKDHKNVVKTHGRTVDKMSCSLVLEYMDDDLLGLLQKRKESQRSPAGTDSGNQSELSRSQPFELPEALDIVVQIARGMEYLHEQNILHGDLKMKNILVTHMNDGDKNLLSVKVADFGLVRTKRKSMSFVSRQARKLDVVQWKAPENLEILLSEDKDETSSESDSNSDEECTGSPDVTDSLLLAADVYSFAVTCSQILTGEDPYPHLNWKELGAKIVSGELRPNLPAACPPLLKDLLVSCWIKAPAQRPTFSNIRTTLEHLQNPKTELLRGHTLHVHKVDMPGELTEKLKELSLQQYIPREDGRTAYAEQHQNSPTLAQRTQRAFDAPMSNLQGISSTDVSVVQTSPERYLELAMECMEKVPSINSLQFNHGLCQYLAIKLLLAIQIAQKWTRSSSLELIESSRGTFKLLFRLAEEVESFIHTYCNNRWIQHTVMFTNVSEYVSSLAYELDFCRMLLPNAEGASLSLTMNESEVEIVRLRATQDEYRLSEKVKALIQSSNDPSSPEYQLANYLLGRLRAAPTMCISGSMGSPSLSFWEVDYDSIEPLEKLGTGAAGIVHKSRWLGELVAEKTFFGSDHPSFSNEVSILAGLSHPNIVPMFCYAMDDRHSSIVMELMEGDLFQLMRTRLRRDRKLACPFSIPEAVDIMLQVAKGVNYLHENGVVHRDLKSHNILVKSAKYGDMECLYAKVTDFAISKTMETRNTLSNQTLNTGTTRWMAPELMQFESNIQAIMLMSTSDEEWKSALKDPFKCDVYSFGMLCYEILTGEVPFQTTSSHNDVKKMVLDGQRPRLPNQCPLYLMNLIQDCWKSDPSARPNFGVISVELRYLKWSLMTDAFKGTEDHMDPHFSSQLDDWMGTILNLRDKILGDEEDLDPMLRHRQLHTMKASLNLPATQLERASSFPAGVSLPMDEAFLLSIPTVLSPPRERRRKKIEPRLRTGFKKRTLEIRPPGFKKKLWFGTYTEEEIDRARDAVNYYMGYNQPYNYPDSPLIFAEKPLKGIKFEDLLPSCDQFIQGGEEQELAYLYFARQVKKVIHSVTGKQKKSSSKKYKCKGSQKLQSLLKEAPRKLDTYDPIVPSAPGSTTSSDTQYVACDPTPEACSQLVAWNPSFPPQAESDILV